MAASKLLRGLSYPVAKPLAFLPVPKKCSISLPLQQRQRRNLVDIGRHMSSGRLKVYRQAPALRGKARMQVNSQIFTDLWTRQENRINLGSGTRVTTLIFPA